ncbi:MAG: hypothetical protein IH869_03870, partial [Chloroflexi bacterium]|nr:hypothetical protein [Chloroflexota bacterium]
MRRRRDVRPAPAPSRGHRPALPPGRSPGPTRGAHAGRGLTVKIGIINVTGYAGIELARILHRHPEADIVGVTGRSAAGEELGDALPHLARLGLRIEPEITRSVDVVFSALPQVASAEVCIPFVRD